MKGIDLIGMCFQHVKTMLKGLVRRRIRGITLQLRAELSFAILKGGTSWRKGLSILFSKIEDIK